MDFKPKVLIVDDNVGSIRWLFDFLEWRGYEFDHVSNEKAARAKLDDVQAGRADYAFAILDIMIAVMDILDIDEISDEFYEKSADTGLRLCRYARNELGISEEKLPIVCLSGRDDDELKAALENLEIPLFSRSGEDIRSYLRKELPSLK